MQLTPSRVPMKCIGIAVHPLPLGEGLMPIWSLWEYY
jgi:hypothetical protein